MNCIISGKNSGKKRQNINKIRGLLLFCNSPLNYVVKQQQMPSRVADLGNSRIFDITGE